MAKFKDGYLEDINRVKSDLSGMIRTYLSSNFPYIKPDPQGKWPPYSLHIYSLFHKPGKQEYNLAVNLLTVIDKSKSSKAAICNVLNESQKGGDKRNVLYSLLLRDLSKVALDLEDADRIYARQLFQSIFEMSNAYSIDAIVISIRNRVIAHCIRTALSSSKDSIEMQSLVL